MFSCPLIQMVMPRQHGIWNSSSTAKMLCTNDAEGYRRRFLERSPRLFDLENRVWLEAMRLVEIGEEDHLESIQINDSDLLSSTLAVNAHCVFLRSYSRS